MEKQIRFQRVGIEDLSCLISLPEGLFDNPIDPDQARAFLSDPLHELVLAYDGDVVIAMASGTILLQPDKPPAFFVNEISVRFSHQCRGIGSEITLALFDIARKCGCQGIWLGTEADNLPALQRSL